MRSAFLAFPTELESKNKPRLGLARSLLLFPINPSREEGFNDTEDIGERMEAITKTETTRSNQPVGPVAPQAAQAPEAGKAGEFDTTLRALVRPDQANKVSEEDLFSALVQERIKKLKGEETLKEFQGMLQTEQGSMTKGDGFIPMEDATKAALLRLRESGKLTDEEADSIYSQAFAGAQLDDNQNALFDSRGGKGDPTVAVATLEQALLSSRVTIEEYDKGTKTAPKRSLEETSNGKSAGANTSSGATGDAGFLFKPVSDSDGKLAILLPPRLTGLAQSVRLLSPSGEALETGRYSGNGNGGREHFRFTKPGAGYPDGLTVEVTLKGGSLIKYIIEETSERNEGGGRSSDAESTSSGSTGNSDPSVSSDGGSRRGGSDGRPQDLSL